MKEIKIRVGVGINQQEEETELKPTLELESEDIAEDAKKKNKKIHSENKFQTRLITLDELKDAIEQSTFITIPRAVKEPYGQPEVDMFEETYLIPFDVDEAKYSLKEFLDRISPNLIPTYSFKTRSNDDEEGEYRYRLIYVFKKPFRKLEDYYIFYHYMLGFMQDAAGEFDDAYAYGMNPDSIFGLKGNAHKSIRCVHQGDIHYSGKIYSQGMILSSKNLKLLKEFEENSQKIIEKLKNGKEFVSKLSPELHDLIVNYKYKEILKMPSRKIYMTGSLFKNGFAQVRGNDMFMMLIRKFKWQDGMYKQVKWNVGEKRKKKLKCDISLMRAIDYIDHREETFTPDELYIALYKEMRKSFQFIDNKDGDSITLTCLEDWINLNLEIPITEIIEQCKAINNAYDSGMIGRKICIDAVEGTTTYIKGRLRPRVICESKGDWFPSYICQRERRYIGRAVNRFDQILSVYDPHKSLKENVELIGNMDVLGMVGYHKDSLEKFIKNARDVVQWVDRIREKKASYAPSDKGNLFKDDWHTCSYGDYADPIFNIAKWIEEDESKDEKLRTILSLYESNKCTPKEYAEKQWADIRSGKAAKPKSGRPGAEWQTHFCAETILQMRPKDVIPLVQEQFPYVADIQVRSWFNYLKKKSANSHS